MSHDENGRPDTDARLTRMANQIGRFFLSKPHAEGVAGVADHINKFWEPRMRRRFLDLAEAGGGDLLPIVREALPAIRRPA
ncbi:MAG: formate dehydrogenase subunit delta [Rhizobiaceae bacterium]